MILEEYLTVSGENTLTTDLPTYMYAVIKPNNDDCSLNMFKAHERIQKIPSDVWGS